jgi:hypothetical protein
MQPVATAKAESRAQFDLDCPGATSQVLNREEIQPLLFGGPQRAQYTIGVSGCGKRATIVVLCSDNNDQCVEGNRNAKACSRQQQQVPKAGKTP